MSCTNDLCLENQTATRADHATLFVSLELSRKKWLVTSLSPGSDKMSKHTVAGGDGDALLALLRRLAAKALARVGKPVNIVSIHEAGLDGFSVHRLLEKNGVASYVVDPASIAVPRRARRAKTDAIDGETLPRQQRAQQRLAINGIGLRSPRTSRNGDRCRIDDIAGDAILLEQSMHGKAVKPGLVDRDDVHRLADPSERFRRQPAQKREQRISVAARDRMLGHFVAARRQRGHEPLLAAQFQRDEKRGMIGAGGGLILEAEIVGARHRLPPDEGF